MEALYLGSAELIRQRISEITDDISSLLVIGHSPGIPNLASDLAWASAPQEADRIGCWFPTAAYTEFTIDVGWSALADSDEAPIWRTCSAPSTPSDRRKQRLPHRLASTGCYWPATIQTFRPSTPSRPVQLMPLSATHSSR